jgi:DNA repair ATPase RecN
MVIGRNFITDSPASLVALKQLGDRLVDMHGPHDHQSLLGAEFQREVLDGFGHTEATPNTLRPPSVESRDPMKRQPSASL